MGNQYVCTSCGHAIAIGALFCTSCGTRVGCESGGATQLANRSDTSLATRNFPYSSPSMRRKDSTVADMLIILACPVGLGIFLANVGHHPIICVLALLFCALIG